MTRILSVATAVPSHRHSQREIEDMFRPHFGRLLDAARRRGIFANAGVQSRHSVEAMEYYFSEAFVKQRNPDYLRHALELSKQCAGEALRAAGIAGTDIRHVFGVTTTGLLTPSLEARLAQALPLSPRVKRTPIFGSGCAGGVVALARAADAVSPRPGEKALVISVELCSLTFEPDAKGMTQLVAAALFGDGAAAVVLEGGPGDGVEILDSASLLFPNSEDAMGWDFSSGMRLVLSREVPSLIESGLRSAVDPFLAAHDLSLNDIDTFLLHPGSLKILGSCQRALGIGPEETRLSREFLARYGNLSSASILFILKEALAAPRRHSSFGLVIAMGPGFAAELLLVRFP